MDDIERSTMKTVWWRLVPLLSLALLCNYLDKVNLGFAALTMNQDLGFSNTVFGAGAGFFAIGYAVFAIPSTLLMHRFGARRWMTIIMIAWGLCSAATAFVKTPEELLLVRLLLGMAEAGFTPGAILYFSYWFPGVYRGRVLGSFLLIYPLSLVIGGPASSGFYEMSGLLGLAAWQWLFIVEALPTLGLAIAVLATLPDKPRDAPWLSDHQKEWLERCLTSESESAEPSEKGKSASAFTQPRVWLLAVANCGLSTSGVGATFFMPLIVRSMGFSISVTGWMVALPGVAAGLTLPLWGMWTDRAASRENVVAIACGMIAAGLLGVAVLLPSPWAIVPMSIAMVGFNGCLVAFWTLPTAFLIGASAAAGIAFINIVGNMGTFTGPYILGWISDQTGSYAFGLSGLAIIAAASAAIMTLQTLRGHRSAAIV